MARIKKGLAGVEEVEAYGDTIPTYETPIMGETPYYEEIDEAQVGLGVGAAAADDAILVPPVTPVSEPKPEPFPTEVVAEVPTEEIVEEIEDPWERPDYGRVEEPEFDPTAIPAVPVEAAPEYEVSPEERAWADLYSKEIRDILREGGRGIPEETQQLMKKQQFQMLKSRETENLRLLRNNMEERGITNSGLIFSEEQKIKSTTTRALAASVTEIQIKSAFMKMASFENALGRAGEFLGYLSQQSQLAYAPKMATWQMEQQAKLVQYQANVDMYKVRLQNAWNVNNMREAAEIQAEAAHQQHLWNIEIAQMEIDAANEAAAAQAGGNIIGMILGGIFRWLFPF